MSFVFTPLRIILFALFSFTLCRLGLYLVHFDYFSVLNAEEIVRGFTKGVQFDSATTMLFCAPMLLLLSFPFKVIYHTAVRYWLTYAAGGAILLMLVYSLADIVYFGEVQRHIGAELLNITADQAALVEIAFTSRLTFTLISFALLVLLAIGYYFWAIVPLKRPPVLTSSWGGKLLAWLGVALLYLILFRGFILSGRSINLSDAFTGSQLQQANLALNPVYVSYRESLSRLKQQPLNYVSAAELARFAQQSPLAFKWQRPANQPTKKNVVLVLLESWSYKYIDGLSGNNYRATPFMDSLIRHSQVWDNFYAAGQRSIIGIQAILSSIPSLQNQPTLGFGLELKEMSRIADIANQHHYRTLMMQSSARRSFHMNSIANALGFQEYYGKEDVPLLREYPQQAPRFGWDYDTLQFLNQKLSEPPATQPFFAFIFTGTTHEPFARTGEQFEIYPHSDSGENGFLNTLRYSDWAVQEFMQAAAKQPWYHNTIFIFTADHTLNAESHESLPQRFHIPLVIFTPDGSLPAKRHQTLASQYDLFPTIMDLLGFNQPIYTFGKSLLSDEPSEFVMLNQWDIVGIVTPTAWAGFTPEALVQQSEHFSEQDKQRLQNLKLRMQYADQLLRENRWKQE